MSNKQNVAILFGGKSAEHEVSLQSAKNIVQAIDKKAYDIILIGIDKQGQWHLNHMDGFLLEADDPKRIKLSSQLIPVTLILKNHQGVLINLAENTEICIIDVAFPVLHGPFGEDGTVQGLLKLANIPFVGADVLGSSICMDKDVSKRLLRERNLPICKFRVFHDYEKDTIDFSQTADYLGLPMFIKPANLGSSVGVAKVGDESGFMAAIDQAFQFDTKILVEECIFGREIECSVLGNDHPIASVPGEIIPRKEFYSYEAKYIDENGARLSIPAELDPDTIAEVQKTAVAVFKTLCCLGMARVDFFLTADNRLYVNELNSIPGFTRISMYPKLWEAGGISYPDLIDRLLKLAIERHVKQTALKTSYDF